MLVAHTFTYTYHTLKNNTLSIMEIKNNPSTHLSFDLNPKPAASCSLSLHSDDHSVEDSKMGVSLFASTLDAADINSNEAAAMKLQKLYRGYRTRRLLADSAVDADKLWWQAIDSARLNHNTISFFNHQKPETAASRWNRISLNASRVGKGLSFDSKAHKLAIELWTEAIDPRHRYGRSLHLYYKEWCKTDARQPFFYWLDVGDGKEVDLKECPRSKLNQQCIKYLGPKERDHYEYIIVEGKIVHRQTQLLLDTNGANWIFVTSASNRLYAGEKKREKFHHSSFLAGGVTLAAGKFDVENGTLKRVSPYSGHYLPTDETLKSFLSFLKENGVDLDTVEVGKAYVYSETHGDKHTTENEFEPRSPISSKTMQSETHDNKKEVAETAEKMVSCK